MNDAGAVKAYVVSLGCDKNRIDTEHMLALLSDGAVVVGEPENADVIIINTCGFVEEAKRESIDAILEMARYKKAGAKALVVTGCLAQRYARELQKELPEVDAFLGVSGYGKINEAVRRALRGERFVCTERIDADFEERVLTTPAHYAYVRIADGCSNNCSYCAIPIIRGPQRSRELKSVLREIERLRRDGVLEVILIAQDTARYGEDAGRRMIAELVDEAAGIMEGGWLRLMYCYPDAVTDELIGAMMKHKSVCRYLDMPVQHFSDKILKSMNRRNTSESAKAAVKRLHGLGFALRTTVMVGFPGETEEDFRILTDCVEELKFENLGCFKYSAEEGTKAAGLPEQVPEEKKAERYDAVMRLQKRISREICAGLKGTTQKAVIDGRREDGLYIARTMGQAPESDGVTFVSSKKSLTPGTFHDVLIKDAYDYDLFGELNEHS